MNSDTLIQMLQNGFRLTLGATTSLIEVVQDSDRRNENLTKLQQEWSQTTTSLMEAIQDPQKRNENLTKLQQEWNQLSEEWVAKGETTEQEARNFVNSLLNQRPGQQPDASSGGTQTGTATTSPEVQIELQELIDQIAAIRTELENERKSSRPEV